MRKQLIRKINAITLAYALCALASISQISYAQENNTDAKDAVNYAQLPPIGGPIEADNTFLHYQVEKHLNDNCCLEITVTHDLGGIPNHSVNIRRKVNGIYQGLTSGIIDANAGKNEVRIEICPEEGEDIEFEVTVSTGNAPFILEFVILRDTIKAEDIAACIAAKNEPKNCWDKEGCDSVAWINKRETIILDEFPGCPLTYEYLYRQCGDEFQVRGAKITFYNTLGCQSLLNYLMDGSINNQGSMDPDRITAVFNKAFRKAADGIFDKWFHDFDANPLQMELFDCDNPPALRTSNVVAYYRGSCVSYCTSYYLDDQGNFAQELLEDDCTAGTTCCKIEREYCMEYDNAGNRIGAKATETREMDSHCESVAVPPTQSCRTNNVIFNFRTLCRPTCDINE